MPEIVIPFRLTAPEPGLLYCSGCAKDKPASEFSRNKRMRNGLANWCKACHRAYYTSASYLAQRKERRAADISHTMLVETRSRARKAGLEFNLTIEDMAIPAICPVFGTPLAYTPGGRTDNTPTVDRIDQAGGYTKGNVAIISWRANRLKYDSRSSFEFRALAAYLERHGL